MLVWVRLYILVTLADDPRDEPRGGHKPSAV